MTVSWDGKRVLITGAGGFIGSHLTETLVRMGVRPRAFVRYNSRGDPGYLRFLPGEMLKEVEMIAGDLRDPQAVDQAAKGCDMVFHLGALISIPYSYQHPYEVAETNFMGTLNILSAARYQGISRVIHTSTSEVYGTARVVPIDETHPLQGQSPYSASKIGADKLAESFYCAYDLPVVTIRPFNTYGPRQSARAIIPTIITQALGSDTIRIGAMDTIRDFTYVTDTVNGFIKAAETEGVEGQTFNLGTGKEISIRDLCRVILEKADHPVEIVIDPNRIRPGKSEVQRLLSDNRRAREILNWSPEVELEEGIQQTMEWIRVHLDLYRVGVYEF